MIFIDCDDVNSDDYDVEFAKELKAMLDESSEEKGDKSCFKKC